MCCVRLHVVRCELRVVAQSSKPVKLFSQQLPTFLLLRDCHRSVAQQCWIRLHSSSNIVGVTHAHYAWFTKTYGLYPSHDALQVPTLLGVVASVYTLLPTRSNNSQCCWRNNVGSCCVCLPTALVTSVKWYWYPCSGRFCAPQQTQWITGFALDFPSTSLANRQWDIKQTNHGTYSNPGK